MFCSLVSRTLIVNDFFLVCVIGSICLSILNEDGWSPGTNVKQILLGIQELFTDPNPRSPANPDSGHMFMKKRAEYDRRIRAQTAQFTPST